MKITLRFLDGRTAEKTVNTMSLYFDLSERYEGTWLGPALDWVAFQHRVFKLATRDGYYDEIGVRLPSGALLKSWVCADES